MFTGKRLPREGFHSGSFRSSMTGFIFIILKKVSVIGLEKYFRLRYIYIVNYQNVYMQVKNETHHQTFISVWGIQINNFISF